MLRIAVAVWLVSASIWSLLGPSPMERLSVVKRDILTSVLAFVVFYALTRTRADMMRWICYAFVVLVSAAIAKRDLHSWRDRTQFVVVVAGLLVVFGLFMGASMQFRAEAEAPDGAGAVILFLFAALVIFALVLLAQDKNLSATHTFCLP